MALSVMLQLGSIKLNSLIIFLCEGAAGAPSQCAHPTAEAIHI